MRTKHIHSDSNLIIYEKQHNVTCLIKIKKFPDPCDSLSLPCSKFRKSRALLDVVMFCLHVDIVVESEKNVVILAIYFIHWTMYVHTVMLYITTITCSFWKQVCIENIDFQKMELLPYDCFAHILSFTSPQDLCRSSLVSSILQSMADSDAVWENFLPSNYHQIVSRFVTSSLSCSSKKQLFSMLCDPRPIDDGNKVTFFSVCPFADCKGS